MNYTILSLNIFSIFSTSPLYTLQGSYQNSLRSLFVNSHFSRSISSVIYSNTNKHQTILHNIVFSHIMSSAIFFKSEQDTLNNDCFFVYPGEDPKDDKFFSVGDLIHDITVNPAQYSRYINDDFNNHRPYFRKLGGQSICGDIRITQCVFENCYAQSYSGGSIHIEQDSSVLIHSTIFSNSYTKKRFGGAGVICKTISEDYPNFNTEQLQRLDIQYCCFQNCYGNDNSQKVYGVALFCAAQHAMLFYASTVNCPGPNRDAAEGAQFDLNSGNVTSHSVNSTGGKSDYCSGIEYRNTKRGFFRFQSISDSSCKYAIAYTDVSGTTDDVLDLSYSNVFKISLNYKIENVYPGLIHVRKTESMNEQYDFRIKNFCFVENNFNSVDAKIISRGTNGEAIQRIKVILEGCSYDCGDDKVAIINEQIGNDLISIINCNLGPEPTFNTVSQLSLGDCQGVVPPVPLTPISYTKHFSESMFFTESGDFTNSNVFYPTERFTKSSDFSKTDYFSRSTYFSETDGFTKSVAFTKSSGFDPTNEFSRTGYFTKTGFFSETNDFTQSIAFTKSSGFNPTKEFSKSGFFSETNGFTRSTAFSRSGYFDPTKEFLQTDCFNQSNFFSRSNYFSETNDFSKSVAFTKSSGFDPTKEFSKSAVFTRSNEFTSSPTFTPSETFSMSFSFTPSNVFTDSNTFSSSFEFSFSEVLPLIADKGVADSGGKSKTGLIAGVTVAAVAVVAIIVVLLAFFMWKKKHMNIDENSADVIDGQESVISVDNNLNTVMQEDDPFATDFTVDH